MVALKLLMAVPILGFGILNSCCASKESAMKAFFPSYASESPFDAEEKYSNDTGEIATLKEMENKMRKFVDAVLRQILPFVIRASSDIRLSGRCMTGIFKLVIGMQKLKEWAIKMVDAVGKPPSGIIQGTSMALGDYDECVNIHVGPHGRYQTTDVEEQFHGKYCTLELKLPKGIRDALDEYESAPLWMKANTSIGQSKTVFNLLSQYSMFAEVIAFRLGVCIPSVCNEEDLKSIISTVSKSAGFPINVLHCEEKPKLTFRTEQIIIIFVLGSIIAAVLAGTAADIYYTHFNIEPTKTRWRDLSIQVSVIRNTQKLFSEEGTEKCCMPMMRGVFLFTVSLNILAHTYFMYNHLYFFKYSSILNFFEFMKQFSFVVIANGSNGIENYFFLAGFLLTYARWRMPLKAVKLDLMRLVVKPYIRMSFLQLLAIGLFLCLPLLGYGPFWSDFVGPYLENCRNRWWVNLLYVQNYWSSEESCLYHTWILAVVMQMYVIAIPILWLLIKMPTFGVASILGVIVAGMAIVGATVFVKELPGALSLYLVNFESGLKMWNSLYTQTFDHIGSFCIGILTGYLLSKYQNTIKLKPVTVIMGWIITVASLSAVTCGLYEYRTVGETMNPSLAILYAMLNREVYASALAWFFVACATGNAWWIPSLLSYKALIPLYRLSFLAYMVHIVIMYFHVGTLRGMGYLSHEENIMNFFGYLIGSFSSAYVLYIFFQAPYMQFEGIVLKKLRQLSPSFSSSGSIDTASTSDNSITIGEEEKTKSPIAQVSFSEFPVSPSMQKKPKHIGDV